MKRGKVIQASLYQELQKKYKAEVERRKMAEAVVENAIPELFMSAKYFAELYRKKYPEGT